MLFTCVLYKLSMRQLGKIGRTLTCGGSASTAERELSSVPVGTGTAVACGQMPFLLFSIINRLASSEAHCAGVRNQGQADISELMTA
jgi:hypothetical protein